MKQTETTHSKEPLPAFQPELDDEEKNQIREVFLNDVVPKLQKLQARNGVICCDFAGTKYKNWQARFTSRGRGFEIVDFEYDEDARSLELDL
ncbi:MAG: hypothetical protein JRI79_07065 [Deltaproteobacteria bacterium]|nr:hypothetical protein [Deltaproteobacteria bacterium]MBW1921399.1 hypothetical protein [Deltaproteobacteria bacterium]MBW1934573.1 hypothetical protein [Deltaproteobacteria bacterium]MBW1977713.1 hypothetical protein [Deltaproteobacteria bacterium]MBW2043427.1 hypothetical protein [Deltaproteobacteria bacterium]